VAEQKVDSLPALTGLRGIGALWVVLFHLDADHGVPFIRNGYLGVDLFFVLSGFILSHVYTPNATGFSLTQYRNFLWFRLVRIYPIHLFSLLILLLVTSIVPGFVDRYAPMQEQRFGVSGFVASLLLIQNWAHWLPTTWNTPAWSLSAEWFAYLIFQPLLLLFQRVRSQFIALFLGTASLIALIVALLLKGVHNPGVTGTPGMLRMLCEFTAGCLLYRAYVSSAEVPLALLTGGAISIIVISMIVDKLIFLSLFGFALIVLLGTQRNGPVSYVLTMRPIMILGEISFSLYMLHWIFFQISNWILEGIEISNVIRALWNIGLVTFILFISFASYHAIERPTRLLGRSIALRGYRWRSSPSYS
jgi:peptidoglycan/LPS O-acetylase OafA/YrhL